jgi:DNA ligase D-like protein (predicted 3'-phosphoesterase)
MLNLMARNPLSTYHAKRHFEETPEPRGGKVRTRGRKDPIFVIQMHAARRLHFDFRLEVDGVLKSWAVPKGPSVDPEDKRLAMPTEDHPMDYADFEGVIPEGHYGAGKVIVWDKGTYKNVSLHNGKIMPMQKALEKGHVTVWLQGEKLKEPYSLIRMHDTGEGDRTPWLLVKVKDPKKKIPKMQIVLSKPRSVLSGKNINEIG